MAQAISLEIPPRNVREELRARLERAPDEHAEAILATYELLQAMHNEGLLEIARGVVSARDEVLQQVANNMSTPEAIRTIRNLVFCGRILGSIEPDWLHAMLGDIPETIAQATAPPKEPVTLFGLLRRLFAKDTMRALAAGIDVLQSFGSRLLQADRSAAHKSSSSK